MTDFAIWKPEHDGHAPPNWREGMEWGWRSSTDKPWRFNPEERPSWFFLLEYRVPPEALNSPNDDAETPDAVETGKLENIIRGLRQYPAETLAKHGITLAPEKDWATELWADLMNAMGWTLAGPRILRGDIEEEEAAAIELLRTRFEHMIAERSKRDA